MGYYEWVVNRIYSIVKYNNVAGWRESLCRGINGISIAAVC